MLQALTFIVAILYGDPPAPIQFPDPAPQPVPVQPPAPPPNPAPIPKLDGAQLYVITGELPFVLLGSPNGLVKITTEAGPLRIRGVFWDGAGQVETRNYKQKQVSIVEASGTGRVELIAIPIGLTDEKAIVRRLVDVSQLPIPPPVPPQPPEPPPSTAPFPVPIPGLHVLIVYETNDLSSLKKTQLAILNGQTMLKYLNDNCPKAADGKSSFRIWDQNVNVVNESKVWKDAFARPRASVPWIEVSNGKTGFEGPLPATVDETIAILKKVGN